MKTKILAAMGTAVAILLGASAASAGPTLNAVKQKGFVQCGVNTGLPGFSSPDSQGNWTGLDVDVCRAVAAAIFGDPKVSVSRRSPPSSVLPPCSPARSICCHATRHGR